MVVITFRPKYADSDLGRIVLQQLTPGADKFNAYLFGNYIGYVRIKEGYFCIMDDTYETIYDRFYGEYKPSIDLPLFIEEAKQYLLLNLMYGEIREEFNDV